MHLQVLLQSLLLLALAIGSTTTVFPARTLTSRRTTLQSDGLDSDITTRLNLFNQTTLEQYQVPLVAAYTNGRLTVSPEDYNTTRAPLQSNIIKGTVQSLGLVPVRDAAIYVPLSHKSSEPTPLIMFLHEANGDGSEAIKQLVPFADQTGALVLAPTSRSTITWDLLPGSGEGYLGPDVAFIDAALLYVFEHFNIDPSHLAVGGFSDGATYALTIGLTNGDLFSHVMAFTPGSLLFNPQGEPQVFISAGTNDQLFPIALAGQKIAQELEAAGYSVDFVEFQGGHELPNSTLSQAMAWFLPS